jgi:hypothetical protein
MGKPGEILGPGKSWGPGNPGASHLCRATCQPAYGDEWLRWAGLLEGFGKTWGKPGARHLCRATCQPAYGDEWPRWAHSMEMSGPVGHTRLLLPESASVSVRSPAGCRVTPIVDGGQRGTPTSMGGPGWVSQKFPPANRAAPQREEGNDAARRAVDTRANAGLSYPVCRCRDWNRLAAATRTTSIYPSGLV